MNLIEQILTVISERLKKSNKKSETFKALKSLQEEIRAMIEDKSEKSLNKDHAYHCSICDKITVSLKNKKYCVACFDKYID